MLHCLRVQHQRNRHSYWNWWWRNYIQCAESIFLIGTVGAAWGRGGGFGGDLAVISDTWSIASVWVLWKGGWVNGCSICNMLFLSFVPSPALPLLAVFARTFLPYHSSLRFCSRWLPPPPLLTWSSALFGILPALLIPFRTIPLG